MEESYEVLVEDLNELDQRQPYLLPLYAFITPALGRVSSFYGGTALLMLVYIFFSGKVGAVCKQCV